MRFPSRLALPSALLLTLGCSPLSPRPDYSKFFVLTPISDTAGTTSSGSTSHLVIGVGPTDFPGYLKRPEVVTRASANRLDVSPVDRWSEPLDKNFGRILEENLRRLLGTEKIKQYPWSRKTVVDYQVEITVQRFETTTDNQARLEARWTIKDGATGKDLFASQTNAATPAGNGDDAIAAALSADLSTLSRDIATQLIQLNEQRRPNRLAIEPLTGLTQTYGNNATRSCEGIV
jgi:uncharacterized protein